MIARGAFNLSQELMIYPRYSDARRVRIRFDATKKRFFLKKLRIYFFGSETKEKVPFSPVLGIEM